MELLTVIELKQYTDFTDVYQEPSVFLALHQAPGYREIVYRDEKDSVPPLEGKFNTRKGENVGEQKAKNPDTQNLLGWRGDRQDWLHNFQGLEQNRNPIVQKAGQKFY